jgi:hypothetical protein
MLSLGVPSGPEVSAAEHKSALTAADDAIGALPARPCQGPGTAVEEARKRHQRLDAVAAEGWA